MFGENQLRLSLAYLLMYQVWGQAPNDYSSECRSGVTDGRDYVVLVDTRDYRELFQGAGRVWIERSYDSNSSPTQGHVSLIQSSFIKNVFIF